MAQAPEYLISHTDEVWYRHGQPFSQKKKHERSGSDLFARSLELCLVGMSTVMAHRRFFEQVGLFDEELACCEDYDLWIRAARRLEFLHIAEPLTIKHGGRQDQLSQLHRIGMDRYRIMALVKLMEEGELSGRQEILVRRQLVKKCLIYGRGCQKHGRREEGMKYLELADKCR